VGLNATNLKIKTLSGGEFIQRQSTHTKKLAIPIKRASATGERGLAAAVFASNIQHGTGCVAKAKLKRRRRQGRCMSCLRGVRRRVCRGGRIPAEASIGTGQHFKRKARIIPDGKKLVSCQNLKPKSGLEKLNVCIYIFLQPPVRGGALVTHKTCGSHTGLLIHQRRLSGGCGESPIVSKIQMRPMRSLDDAQLLPPTRELPS
jgi:hypothetical protein